MGKVTLAVIATAVVLAVFLAAPKAALLQQYQPSIGQEGKDVIWVPTPEEVVTAMLDMAKVAPGDYLIDLGSGDGRIVIAAAKRGARALGIEYNPDMVELSKASAEKEGLFGRAAFRRADIFEIDFSQATVITMYLLPHLNMKLRPKILAMKPGTRVVSHAYDMEDWEPDQTARVGDRNAYFWIVPARVAGTWTWDTPSGKAELRLDQTHQKIEGALRMGDKELPLVEAELQGDRIGFTVGESELDMTVFAGRVNGTTIEGLMKTADTPSLEWTAVLGSDPDKPNQINR